MFHECAQNQPLRLSGSFKLLNRQQKMEPPEVPSLICGMGHPAGQRTILVVEDELFIRMSAMVTLQDEGFLVLAAKNSAEALDVLSRHSETDVLMTDVRMPGGMDGLALIAQVQIDHPAIRSIVVSGNASAEQARNAGASGFVAKPYFAQTMVQAVHDILLRT
jgi:DNA-binding NtrC family response regulator